MALWFAFLDHIPGNSLSWLTLRNYGFSDTTEVFFFVSGYTCMVAYGKAQREAGWRTATARAFQCGWEIYRAFLILLLAYLALVQLLGGTQELLDVTNTGVFFAYPETAIVRSLLFQYSPVNTDVLPTFVLLHTGFPALLWLLSRSLSATLAGSLLFYLGARLLDWNLPSWPRGYWYFNPFAWQVLFVFGAWCATNSAACAKAIARSNAAILIASLYLAFSLAVVLSWHIDAFEALLPQVLLELIYPIDKSSVSPLRLLHFVALAVVAVRLVPHQWHALIKGPILAMIRCGENSLPIYCLGVSLAFIAHVVLTQVYDGFAMQALVSFVGIALMIVAANIIAWMETLDWLTPKLRRLWPPLGAPASQPSPCGPRRRPHGEVFCELSGGEIGHSHRG